MRTITVGKLRVWPPRPRPQHAAPPDPRSWMRRWEDGPDHPPAPPGGSMLPDYEQAGRLAYQPGLQPLWTEQAPARVDDTGEHTSTIMLPRLGAGIRCDGQTWEYRDGPGEAWQAEACPDPAAHLYSPEADVYVYRDEQGAADVEAVLAPIEARARALDPEAWRVYLTREEFAETFPGVPYSPADAGWPELLDGLDGLDPDHAEQVLEQEAAVRDYVAQRGAAFALDRGRNLQVWRQIRQ